MTTSENSATQKEKISTSSINGTDYYPTNSTSNNYQAQLLQNGFYLHCLSSNTKEQYSFSFDKDQVLMCFSHKGLCRIQNLSQTQQFDLQSAEANLLLCKTDNWLIKSTGQYSACTLIVLEKDFLYKYLPAQYLPAANKDSITPIFAKKLHLCPKLDALLTTIDQCKFEGHLKTLYTKAKIIELLALLLAQHEEEKTLTCLKPKEIEKMQLVKRLIEENLDQNPTIALLARTAGTNEQYLKKHFKTLFGHTVFGYITSCKMEKAKNMLLSGAYKITEVAEKSGYKHATHFTSAPVFRTGTPKIKNRINFGVFDVLQ